MPIYIIRFNYGEKLKFKAIAERFETKKTAVVAKVSNDKSKVYVPTLVMVADAVLLGFVLINIFDVLFDGVIKQGLTDAFTSIFTNLSFSP